MTDIDRVEVGVTYENYNDADEIILVAEVNAENPYTDLWSKRIW